MSLIPQCRCIIFLFIGWIITIYGQLSTSDKQAILDLHNEARNRVAGGTFASNEEGSGFLPAATDMEEMIWDPALEAWAENIAERCLFGHIQDWDTNDLAINSATFVEPDSVQPIGENLAYSSAAATSDVVIDLTEAWIEEGNYYGFGTFNGDETCNPPASLNTDGCGHFTQIVWADTRYVGCGVADCGVGGIVIPGGSLRTQLVCLYYSAGNFINNEPYDDSSTTQCANCDGDRDNNCDSSDSVRNNLCAGGLDSSFENDDGTDIDVCDNGLGEIISNECGSTPTPVTPSPITSSPTTSSPNTPSPVTPAPITPTPITPSPVTPSPVTPSPVTPSPVTPSPVTTTTTTTTASTSTSSVTTPSLTTPSPDTSTTNSGTTTSEQTTTVPTTSEPTATTTAISTSTTITTTTTSSDSTTANPTTNNPTTSEPTTANPTTATPTNNPIFFTTIQSTASNDEPDTTIDPIFSATIQSTSTQDDSNGNPFNLPQNCSDRCDSFSVIVENAIDNGPTITLTYRISRLFNYSECSKGLDYLTLGLCNEDQVIGNKDDISQIILDFDYEFQSQSRRRLGRGAPKCWGSGSKDALAGITIDFRYDDDIIDTQDVIIELVLEDIFENITNADFSSMVRFDRGNRRNEYNCDEDYVQGLPCIDVDKYIAAGYPKKGREDKWNSGGKNKNGGKYSALSNDELKTDSNWGALSEMDPMGRWALLSLFMVFGLLLIVCGVIIIIRSRRKKEGVTLDKMERTLERQLSGTIQSQQHVVAVSDSTVGVDVDIDDGFGAAETRDNDEEIDDGQVFIGDEVVYKDEYYDEED